MVHRDDGNGRVTISETRPPRAKGVDGQGTICTLTFKAMAPGDSQIALVRVGAKDSRQDESAGDRVAGRCACEVGREQG